MEFDASVTISATHRVRFTTDVFSPQNETLACVLGVSGSAPARILVVVDQGLADRWPELSQRISDYVDHHKATLTFADDIRYVSGGERCKNDRAILDDLLQHIHDAALCRHSYVVVIGGGAVLDVVGFAAATAHRGVRLVRLPTTTLAQADSGVGVKNGINAFGKKNYLGTFSVPHAVINDSQFLTTLSDRDWRCGFSEAVKVALIKDKAFFSHINANASRLEQRDMQAALPIIQQSCEIHLKHIVEGGDPYELTEARPLDFGHWAAHKLEQMTDYRLRHGEAVAIGIMLDVIYSAMAGHLAWCDVETVQTCLRNLGFVSYDHIMDDSAELLDGVEEFREHLGGKLNIVLLRGIGQGFVVHDVEHSRMADAVKHLASLNGQPSSD